MADAPRDNNRITTLLGVSSSDGTTPVTVYVDPTTHRLYCDVSISSVTVFGSKSNNTAVPGSTNLGTLPAIATNAAPSYTEGYQVGLSTDLSGQLRVTGSLSVGGTTDNSAFTAGSSTGTPTMGFYHSTIDTVTDGRSAVVGMTSKRALFVNLQNSSGVEIGTASNPVNITLMNGTTAVIGAVTQSGNWTTRIVGNAGATLDATVGAGTAPTNMLVTGGIYNSTEPSPTNGQSLSAQFDAKGRQRMVLMDAAGNTRGANVDASNRLSVSVDAFTATNASVNVAQMNGVTVTMGNGVSGTGVQRVAIASDNTVLPGVGAGATASTVPANASYKGGNAITSLPSSATAGNLVGASFDKYGRQVVLPLTIRDLIGTQAVTLTNSTAETTIINSGGSGVFNDLMMLVASNTSATASRLDIRDTTAGTVLLSLYVPAGDTRGFSMGGVAVPQTTANTTWTVQSSASVTDIRVYSVYAKNK